MPENSPSLWREVYPVTQDVHAADRTLLTTTDGRHRPPPDLEVPFPAVGDGHELGADSAAGPRAGRGRLRDVLPNALTTLSGRHIGAAWSAASLGYLGICQSLRAVVP
jgi:hypothetical protein